MACVALRDTLREPYLEARTGYFKVPWPIRSHPSSSSSIPVRVGRFRASLNQLHCRRKAAGSSVTTNGRCIQMPPEKTSHWAEPCVTKPGAKTGRQNRAPEPHLLEGAKPSCMSNVSPKPKFRDDGRFLESVRRKL